MANATKNTVTGSDYAGNACRTSFYSDTGAHALDLANAIAAASNASLTKVIGFSEQTVTPGTGTPLNDQYPSTQDKAVLIFRAADNSVHKYQVPAPLSSLFDADFKYIDDTGGAATLITAYLDYAFTPGGEVLSEYLRGHRSFRKSRKF